MESAAKQQKNREMAYFKFALIAPAIQGTLTDPSIAAYCRRVTENPIARPDGVLFQYKPTTLERWVTQYKEGGMEALMPKERSDKGSVRTLSDECILEIYRLKEKFPKLDAVQIRLRLVQDGFIPSGVSPRTIQRFIKSKGLKNAPASGLLKDRKAFEEEFFGSMWQAEGRVRSRARRVPLAHSALLTSRIYRMNTASADGLTSSLLLTTIPAL